MKPSVGEKPAGCNNAPGIVTVDRDECAPGYGLGPERRAFTHTRGNLGGTLVDSKRRAAEFVAQMIGSGYLDTPPSELRRPAVTS
jgi:hypothetical protein